MKIEIFGQEVYVAESRSEGGELMIKVLPFFEQQNMPMLRILTDRGTEYCGVAENIMTINFIWHSTILSTPKLKHSHRKRMVFVNDFIKPF